MSRQPTARLSPTARDQRERLIEGMTRVVAAVGYENASVERVLAQAGVSRRSFYELFRDREDCFLAVYDDGMGQAFDVVGEAYLDCEAPERRIEGALEALLGFWAGEPELARTCIVEVFAAGPAARARRADAMARLAGLMEHGLNELRGDRRLDRLSAQALVGGVHELIYAAVERGDAGSLPGLAGEIVASQVAPLVRVPR